MVYKRPGVYISENLTPLAASPDTSGTATAAFVGVSALGGPTLPTFVTSWAQYVALFGGFNGTDFLPYSVYEYFNNGGSGCYIVRAAASDAVAAHVVLQDTEVSPAPVLTVTAIAPGVWGNAITVEVKADGTRFDLVVTRGVTVESFNSLSLDPADSRNAISVVNSPVSGSALVALTYTGPSTYGSTNAPAIVSAVSLASGSEGSATPDLVAATALLDVVITPLDINLPGVNSSTTINAILSAWAGVRNNVFLVVDGIKGATNDSAATNATAQEGLITGGSSITPASTVGIYAPWIISEDPSSTVPGASKLLPPGGFVLGQFARSDIVKGVQKAPAGTSTSLRGALAPVFRYSSADLDAMAPVGLNIIRTTPGAGICIWGARTTKVGMPDRYISVRRTLIYLEYALTELTRPAIFEDNDADLWSYLTQIISQFLQSQWQAGVLKGASATEAFYIECDAANNPPSSANAGQVNIQIGVALSAPAEFIVINIGQQLVSSTAA
jgi:phage tail sheath protein FI